MQYSQPKRPFLRYCGGKLLLSYFINYLLIGIAFADGAAPRVECLWINPAAASKLNKKLF